jgi:hypothetical protein
LDIKTRENTTNRGVFQVIPTNQRQKSDKISLQTTSLAATKTGVPNKIQPEQLGGEQIGDNVFAFTLVQKEPASKFEGLTLDDLSDPEDMLEFANEGLQKTLEDMDARGSLDYTKQRISQVKEQIANSEKLLASAKKAKAKTLERISKGTSKGDKLQENTSRINLIGKQLEELKATLADLQKSESILSQKNK